MSKRRRRKKAPNIPQETLERARRQAVDQDEDAGEAQDDQAEVEAELSHESALASEQPRRRRRERLEPVGLDKKTDQGERDSTAIAEALANPTIFVSEEQLRAEYSFVLKDLRDMGLLAAALFVVLVLVAQFL